MSPKRPKPRFGWREDFRVGSRVKYNLADAVNTKYTVAYGDEGEIIKGDGKPAPYLQAKGTPMWIVHFDSGFEGAFFEWALELI